MRPPLKVFGGDYPTPDGTCLRDYVHVDDLARAHIAVFPKLMVPGTCVDYNLGTGTPTSVREVIEAVESVTGLKVPHEMAPRREGDPPALSTPIVRRPAASWLGPAIHRHPVDRGHRLALAQGAAPRLRRPPR